MSVQIARHDGLTIRGQAEDASSAVGVFAVEFRGFSKRCDGLMGVAMVLACKERHVATPVLEGRGTIR